MGGLSVGDTRIRQPRRSLRHWLASFAWAAAVNYSLIAGTDPPVAEHPRSPIATYRREQLVDGTWAAGEYVPGAVPRIIVYTNSEQADSHLDGQRSISLN